VGQHNIAVFISQHIINFPKLLFHEIYICINKVEIKLWLSQVFKFTGCNIITTLQGSQ